MPRGSPWAMPCGPDGSARVVRVTRGNRLGGAFHHCGRYLRSVRRHQLRQLARYARRKTTSPLGAVGQFVNRRILRWQKQPTPLALRRGSWEDLLRPPDFDEATAESAATQVCRGTLRFLSEEEPIRADSLQWRPVGHTRLWGFHLHYFDYLVDLAWLARQSGGGSAEACSRLQDLVLSWIESCPPAWGDPWHPYVVSLRIVNWLRVLAAVGPELRASTVDRMFRSLGVQLAHLESNIEWDIDGNHLLKNGKALLFAAHLLAGPRVDKWRALGERILRKVSEEQFLADGCHFERAPMYHCQVLSDYLDLLQLVRASGGTGWRPPRALMASMTGFLDRVIHPDGNIPLINDSALGPTASAARLVAKAAEQTGVPTSEHDRDHDPPPKRSSGFHAFGSRGRGLWLIVDADTALAPHVPGHLHAGLLGYELSMGKHRFLVDSGVYEYEAGAWRDHFRSTAAHNTVTIDGVDSSEVWGSFRLGRSAEVEGTTVGGVGDMKCLVVTHNGYRWLAGRVTHTRFFAVIDDEMVIVADRVSGTQSHEVASLIHLHPEVQAQADASGLWFLRRDSAVLCLAPADGLAMCEGEQQGLGRSYYSERMGVRQPNVALSIVRRTTLPAWTAYAIAAGPQRVRLVLAAEGETATVEVHRGGRRWALRLCAETIVYP